MKYWIIIIVVFFSCEKKEKSIEASENHIEKESISEAKLNYVAPKTWIQEKSISAMRKAQFKIPGKKSDLDGEMAIFHFPDMNVDPQLNLDRWIRQFKIESGKSLEDVIERQDFTIKDMKINYIKLDGTYKKPASMFIPNAEITELAHYTLLAAIINTNNGPWFFKAIGPTATMKNAKPDFEAMILSVK